MTCSAPHCPFIRNGKTFWSGIRPTPARAASTVRNTNSSRSSKAGPGRTSTILDSALRAAIAPTFWIIPASIALIIQNVGAIAALSAESKIVDVRPGPAFEDRDEFVFRTVEAALAGVGLIPDQKVFPFRIKGQWGAA